ncbi:MAG: glycosyltransferase family 4 protein [Saprospiraceae bacterium]|nr:glycosyltransferase family 4 protein [Saprospiraceae bacterium]MDW8483702.1 glycosyltransferase family 1 protein [Saprospiraceae bacterium]
MRIAVNTRFLLPGRLEGIGWYIHEILRRIVEAHPEDEFIFFFDRPYDTSFLYRPNVRPVVLFPPARHPILWYAWFEWAVPRVLKQYQPEVFFSPDGYLSLKAKTPTLLTVHDIIPLQEPESIPWAPRIYYRHFLPRYIRKATCIVTVSEHVQRLIIDSMGLPPARVQLVYNGYRAIFRPLSTTEKQVVQAKYSNGAPYFLHVGAIHPRKNVARLIEAFDIFKALTKSPIKLLLAGRMAWQSEPVRKALQKAQYRADIRILGYVSDAELARLCGAALALVNVSLNEGFGLPTVEALACDTPVLCSNHPALAEVAGDAALFVHPKSVEEIARGLKQLAESPALRQALVEKGRVQRQQFCWNAAAQQIYQLLQQTAGGDLSGEATLLRNRPLSSTE